MAIHILDETQKGAIGTEKRVRDTLLDSEIFIWMHALMEDEVHLNQRGTRADLSIGPTGSGVALPGEETAGNILAELDELLRTDEAPTQEGEDTEGQITPMTHPNDLPELIMSAGEANLRRAGGSYGEREVGITQSS